jgi:hypothetical protein
MKTILEAAGVSIGLLLITFWLPLIDLYNDFGGWIFLGMLVWVLVTTPYIHDLCEKYPHPIRTRDCLR